MIMSYIHELPGWPKLTWDSGALSGALAAVRHKQGKHLGAMGALGFDLRAEASLTALTNEVVKSSAIEGEHLNPEEVRSSIARRLGLPIAGLPGPSRQVEGVVEMMLDATRHFDAPLTKARLFDWHAALFPTGRSGMHRITVGAWRTGDAGPMQVVSGPIGRERVHFEAPGAERLEAEMQRFLEWFNAPSDVDPVLRAGVAHFWFVTIHPFDDGNGRIARAIADMALSQADGTKDRFYSMSSGIEQRAEGVLPPARIRPARRSRHHHVACVVPWMSRSHHRGRSTRRSARCSTRRSSGSESTAARSMNASERSSIGCWTTSRVTSPRRSTPSSPSAQTTRRFATSANCWTEASSSRTRAAGEARATAWPIPTT